MKPNKAVSLGESKASKIQTNSSKIESNEFGIDKVKNNVIFLNEELNEFRVELDDTRNRVLRKTLIFKNIPFKKKETWDKSKEILVKEIKRVLPNLEEHYIMNKIERAHRSREMEYTNTSAIIAEFNLQKLLKLVLSKPSHIYFYLKCIHQHSLKEGMKQ